MPVNLSAILQISLALLVVYLAMSNNLEPANLLLGSLIALGASFLLRPQKTAVPWRRLPLSIFSALRYLVVLIADMLISGVQVGRIVLNPRLPIKPGIVAIDAGGKSDLATALNAHATSLTPGELVIEIDQDGVLYTHCLDATKAADYTAGARRIRKELLSKIFE